jgi:MinD superfamily P-loop ATPase
MLYFLVVEKIAFLRISKKIVNNKTYLTAIVKSYRDKEGRPRHKVLNYFRSVTEDMAERLRFVFSKDFNPGKLINAKDPEFDEAVDYGNFFPYAPSLENLRVRISFRY